MILDKKDKEKLCLDKVINAGKLLHGESKRIIKKISVREFDRDDTERPDFVRYFPPTSKHDKATLIGIEHFRVDHFSLEKKNGKIASKGSVAEKEAYEIYERWHEKVTISEKIEESFIADISKFVALQIERQEKSSYNTFFKSFEYSLNKHLESVEAYRTNLKTLSKEKYNIELAFLIEICSGFKGLCLNNHKGTYKQEKDFIPIFEDMVHLMEENIDCHKVDYIIFCISEILHTNNPKVIAIRTNNIRKNLERQNIIIYEYAGQDLIFNDFEATKRKVKIEPYYSINDDGTTFGINCTNEQEDEQFMMDAIFYSFSKAFECYKQGKNFVTTIETQMLLEVLGDYVIGWEDTNYQSKIKYPIMKPIIIREYLYKMELFEKKWDLKRNGE